MKRLLQRAAISLAGVVAMLAYWSFTGDSSSIETKQGIPAQVWGGGAGKITIEVETTTAARFSISFDRGGDEKSLDTWAKVGAGTHSWTIDVPAGVGGVIELSAEEPRVGDTLKWRILSGGNMVHEFDDSLKEALKPGYGFFLQVYFDDYAKGTLSEDD